MQVIAFLVLSGVFAILLWVDRLDRLQDRDRLRLLRSVVLVLLPAGAFWAASSNDLGSRLTMRLDHLFVPQSVVTAAKATDFSDFLTIGDRASAADIAVAPYIDSDRSRMAMPPEPRAFVTVTARAPTTPEGRMEVRVLPQSFAGIPDYEIPGMATTIDGQRIDPGTKPEPRTLAPNQAMRITISRIDGADKWAERRSFTLSYVTSGREPRLDLALDRRISADAGSCDRPRLRLAPSGADGDPAYRDPENLEFAGLGDGGSNPVIERKSLGLVGDAATLCATNNSRVTWPAAGANVGAPARLSMEAAKIFLPRYCLLLIVLCVIAMHWLCAPGWHAPTPERIVVPLLQWLLILRMLIGVAGVFNNPDLNSGDVYWDVLSAFLCLPVLATVVLRPGGNELRPLLAGLALLVVMGTAGIAIAFGPPPLLSLGLCGVTLIAILGRMVLGVVTRLWAWLIARVKPIPIAALVRTVRGVVARFEPAPQVSDDQTKPGLFIYGSAIVLAAIAVRFALVGIGSATGLKMTERFFSFPLSAIYVPAVILGFAMVLAHDARSAASLRRTLWIALLFAGAYFFVPMVTHDWGALFVYGWPLGLVIAWMGLRFGWARSPFRSIVYAGICASPALLVAGYAAIALNSNMPSPATEPGAYMARANAWDLNQVRLLAFVAPSRVEAIGTKSAFESLDQMTSLEPLTRSATGEGYLAPSHVRPPLLDNQYSDNLSAIHLIWPLGRLGILGLLAVLLAGVFALRPPPRPYTDGETPDWAMLTAIGAGLTFYWAGTYMILANLDWVPFTGRNIYLLAATSTGDLLEGFLLVLMAATAALFGARRVGGS